MSMLIGWLLGFFRIQIRAIPEKNSDNTSSVYEVCFPRSAVALFCWFSGDGNLFHRPRKFSGAFVPGAMIVAGVGGAISQWMPGQMLCSATQLMFKTATPIGGAVTVKLLLVRSSRISQVAVEIRDPLDQLVLEPVTVTLMVPRSVK